MESAMDSPLSGLRVLDLSRVLAGPYVGRLLADLGAQVVKVEAPEGDQSRYFGEVRHGLSGFYTQFNVGKQNVCINLRTPEGRELLLELIGNADILIENFRPGVMARLGLAPATLHERNPALIMLSISGFGQTGQWSQRPAYASIVHAEAGLMSRQSTLDECEPKDIALAVGDYYAALHGLVAVLAAVRMVERTGTGQHIDMSMFDAMLATDDYAHGYLDEAPTARVGGEIWSAPGGPIVIGSVLYNTWGRIRRTFGLTDGLDPDTSLAQKVAVRRRLVQEWMLSFASRRELCTALDQARLVWGDIRAPSEALLGELAAHRSAVVAVDDHQGGTRPVVNSPYRYSAAATGPRGPAPHRGAHNEQVLADWLSLPHDQVRALYASGALESEATPRATSPRGARR